MKGLAVKIGMRSLTILILLIPALALAGEPMDVADVLELLEAGVSERVVLAQIDRSGADFRLSTDDILELEEQGVSERIIEAMIVSGAGERVEEEIEMEEEAVVVPAHLGFYRYDDPGYINVRMVPWSVPDVRYMYVDYDPWWYGDPWWWDTNFYVSYHWYPRYTWGWGFGGGWGGPRYGYGWHDPYWHHPVHHVNHYDYDGHRSGGIPYREGTWKKKSTHRSAGQSGAAATVRGSARTRTSQKAVSSRSVTARKKYRTSSSSSTARRSAVSKPATTRKGSRAGTVQRAPTRSSGSTSRVAPPKSSGSRVSKPSRTSRSSGATRSSPARSSGRSSSSGEKKSKGRK